VSGGERERGSGEGDRERRALLREMGAEEGERGGGGLCTKRGRWVERERQGEREREREREREIEKWGKERERERGE
jgi:hypothetical protein